MARSMRSRSAMSSIASAAVADSFGPPSWSCMQGRIESMVRLFSPAAYSTWIRITRSTARSGYSRCPPGVRSEASRPCSS